SHGTINRWLAEAGLLPNGGNGDRARRPRRELDDAAKVIVGAEHALAEMDAGPTPRDRVGAIDYLRRRLEQVSRMAQQYGAQAAAGATGMADFERAIKLEQSLAAQIAQLSPQEERDPEHDPTNVEAAAETRRRLVSLVEAAERVFKCKVCGQNPHGRGGA